ncbi:MAG TPA: transporter substrate-binding domain-containing protein [Lichenihabitans sp.]|nr:transporter substrate-binding domain-containing protein [Lichenihabitans sp.]
MVAATIDSCICKFFDSLRGPLIGGLILLLLPAAALAAETAPSAPSGNAAGVFVPSFWDPAVTPEKPDPDTLRSIRFLTEGDDPPFGFTLSDGTLVGFDVDLARALCAELDVTCTIQVRPFDTIVPAIRAGLADAAIASLAITDDALAQVDFTSPYYKTPARFATRTETSFGVITPDVVAGKRVGVARGTAHEAFLKAFFPNVDLRPYGDAAEARAALKAGAVDLVFGDGIALAQWLGGPDAAACCSFAGGPYTESRFFGDGAGIAVRHGDDALRAALDYALARVAAKGRYADLYLKYFPIGLY